MTLQELAQKEMDLYSKALSLCNRIQTKETDEQLRQIFIGYKKVHQSYAYLSGFDVEALKRGLFIQWYALAEPNYLTGISDLDEEAENQILINLSVLIDNGKIDYELTWMLNYYANKSWIFERLDKFNGFDKRIVNEENGKLPDSINRKVMASRGQMGTYWNSLTKFKAK